MKKVIIYGGAFNPPTVAHQQIAQAVLDFGKEINADLWFLPSGQREDKMINTSTEVRINYLEGLIASLITDLNVEICKIELNNSGLTHTIETCKYLENNYPDKDFIWVFGSDSVRTMKYWLGGEWLVKNLKCIVVQRPGQEIKANEFAATYLDVNQTNISSTEVRNLLINGHSVHGLVPKTVEHLLY